jgi:hypothetical protein
MSPLNIALTILAPIVAFDVLFVIVAWLIAERKARRNHPQARPSPSQSHSLADRDSNSIHNGASR